ncbi:MAG: hypothetical protein ACYC5H_14705 [Methylovirgula sp.]
MQKRHLSAFRVACNEKDIQSTAVGGIACIIHKISGALVPDDKIRRIKVFVARMICRGRRKGRHKALTFRGDRKNVLW